VRRQPLFTIGYEGRELAELVAELGAYRIDRVIDVRALPLSRRRGFSKTPLGAALREHAIEYVHLRAAGNPYRHDDLPRDEMLAKYARYLAGMGPAIAEVADAARGRRAALLCYERAPSECHRSVLAKRVARRLRATIVDL
jgi:uncharacterized protein (DUF488 family)